jgi:hypothetical protein
MSQLICPTEVSPSSLRRARYAELFFVDTKSCSAYLRAQMGHLPIRVTLDLYGHLFPDANRGELANLDALTTPVTAHRGNARK